MLHAKRFGIRNLSSQCARHSRKKLDDLYTAWHYSSLTLLTVLGLIATVPSLITFDFGRT